MNRWRERVWVRVASFATRQANKVAKPFHGDPRPYWFMVPDRRPEPEPVEIEDGFGL